jgi:hypothetical protein
MMASIGVLLPKGGLGQVFVVELAIAGQGLFKVFAAHETMGLQDVRGGH